MKNLRIAACIVCYQPEQEHLRQLVMSLESQCAHVYILDNGGAESWSKLAMTSSARVEYLSMGGNVGIACALNSAAARALTHGADFLALFDQDSSPPADMIERLLESYFESGGLESQICAIGPRCVDFRQTPAVAVPALRKAGLMPRHVECNASQSAQVVDFLITSGSVVNLTAFRRIGLFDDELFVSYVDLEWGIRATSMGYKLIYCCSVEMPHEFGSGIYKRVLGRAILTYQPIRYYYQARSWILLLCKRHIPFGWKLQLCRWLITQVIGLLIMQNGELQSSLRAFGRGVIDGIRVIITTANHNKGSNL